MHSYYIVFNIFLLQGISLPAITITKEEMSTFPLTRVCCNQQFTLILSNTHSHTNPQNYWIPHCRTNCMKNKVHKGESERCIFNSPYNQNQKGKLRLKSLIKFTLATRQSKCAINLSLSEMKNGNLKNIYLDSAC